MRLPRVAANFAISIDGKIAARGRGPTRFTSEADRRRMLELRAGADAILVGRGTLEADDMPLRLPSRRWQARRLRAGKPAEPLRVVFTHSGRLRKNLRIFRDGAPVVVFTTRAMPPAVRRRLENVAVVKTLGRGKTVDVGEALALLARDYGVRTALCEGGGGLFRDLVAAQAVQELHVTIAPLVIGGAEAPTLLGPAAAALLPHSVPLRLENLRRQGREIFATYRFPRSSAQ